MNKKLIKQLEGIGAKYFETANRGGVLANRKPVPLSNKGLYWGFYTEENVFQVWNGSSLREGIKNPTFTLILKAIKKHTGQDLTPKLTKRQEIDKNTARSIGNNAEIVQNRKDIKKFNRNAEENKIATLSVIDRLKERIEVLEKDKAIQAIEGIKDLVIKVDSMVFPRGGVSSAAVHGGECVLSKSIIENMAKPTITEESVFEHGSGESRKVSLHGLEEKPFEVGDSVVIVCEAKEIYNDELISAIKNRETLIVAEPFCDPRNKIAVSLNAAQYFLSPSDLEHAPVAPKEKALVFGGWAECLTGESSETNYCKGQRVLIIDTSDDKDVEVVINGQHSAWLNKRDLKAL